MSFKSFIKKAGKVAKKALPIAASLIPGIPGVPIPSGVKAIVDKFNKVKSKVKKVTDVIGPEGDRTGRGPVDVNNGEGPVNNTETNTGEPRSVRAVARSPIV